ncbi:hypothetical protein BLX41_07155 [Pseudomonas protegens]|nr:hypothetical protein BLX41_07155 [Pseudomonas protegens]
MLDVVARETLQELKYWIAAIGFEHDHGSLKCGQSCQGSGWIGQVMEYASDHDAVEASGSEVFV